jgi:hypothetical protein
MLADVFKPKPDAAPSKERKATMNPYYRASALERLPSNFNHLLICSEYGWRDYHYILHSCYAQPDASYWIEAVFELWRNTIMLLILTTLVLSVFAILTLAANGAVWLIMRGANYAYNAAAAAVKTPHPITLQFKSQNN